MTTLQKWMLALALALGGLGAYEQWGGGLSIPGVEWQDVNLSLPTFGANSSGKLSVCIVEETADRTKLTRDQQAAIGSLTLRAAISAKGVFVGDVDQNIVGPDRQPPADLKPWLDAAKGQKLPVLLYRHGTGKIVVAPLISEVDVKKRLSL